MPLFDPHTGKVLDKEALGSLRFQPAGRRSAKSRVNSDDTKTTEVLDDESGRVMAHTTDHKSGRVDQRAFPEPANVGAETGL